MKQISSTPLPERKQLRNTIPLHKTIDTATQDIDESKPVAKLGLEDLAVELKLALLLNLPNLSDLQSLVHASPLYHSVYRTDRYGILQRVLLNELDQRSFQYILNIGRALNIRHKRPEAKEEILKFLEVFKNSDIEPASELQAVFLRHGPRLARIQLSVEFAMHDFCTSVISKHPTTGEPLEEDVILSPTERARISRAFYRCQIFCIVFREDLYLPHVDFNITEKSFLFLNLFPPWENEEIACVVDYMKRKYATLYEKHATALSKRPADEFCCSGRRGLEPDDVMLDEYIERCISRGIPHLQTILQAPSPKQVKMLWDNMLEMGYFLTGLVEETPYDFMSHTQRYHDWMNQAELRFTKDTFGNPNAAWPWSTGNKVEILYNERPELIEWGYVFWDKERLDRWGILEQDNTPYLRTNYH